MKKLISAIAIVCLTVATFNANATINKKGRHAGKKHHATMTAKKEATTVAKPAVAKAKK